MWRVTYHAKAWFLLPAGALRLAVLPSVENAHANLDAKLHISSCIAHSTENQMVCVRFWRWQSHPEGEIRCGGLFTIQHLRSGYPSEMR